MFIVPCFDVRYDFRMKTMYCRSLFVLLFIFLFWPLCCLSSDLRILITPLVSSISLVRLYINCFVGGPMFYLCYLLAHIVVSNTSYKRQQLPTLRFASTWVHPRILVGSVLLIFLVFCVVFLCFVCLCLVSCMPNVVSFSGVSILDCLFDLCFC